MKKYLFLVFVSLSSFFVHAEGIKLSCLPEQEICKNCNDYQTLFPIEDFSQASGSLDIEADESEILASQTYHLEGDVKVKSDEFILRADEVEVNSQNETTTASGGVRFQDNSFLISGDTFKAKKDNEENLIATLTNANYQDYLSGQGGANGFSEIIEKTPTSVFLTNATYSLCPVNKNNWLIDAKTIELNLSKNRGVASNAKVIFYGIPIFYTPKYSWVLSGRGSGFLTPDYDNYRESTKKDRSFRVRVPYYFNIAPDRDLVLALTYMSSRGLIYEGKYRQLIAPKITEEGKDSIWQTEVIYLAEDKMTNLKRWLINTSVDVELSEKLHLSSRYYRVSDKKYFEEVLRTNTNTKTLVSSFFIDYEDETEKISASLLSEHVQVVNLGSPPYTKAIEGRVVKSFNLNKKKVDNYYKSIDKLNLKLKRFSLLENSNNSFVTNTYEYDKKTLKELKKVAPTATSLTTTFVSTKFKHADPLKESGDRIHGALRLSKQLPLPKYPKITPYTSIAVTKYSLNKAKDISRTIGGAGLDIDFTVNNKLNILGTKINHRFSPIITYNYRAKKLQGNIPIFDGKDKHDDIVTFADLTSGERYTGLDRVTNANDIILSLESSFRNDNAKSDDKDLLNMKIAQSFYTDDEVVSDNLNTNYEVRKSYSDIAASVSLSYADFTLSTKVQFNPDKSQVSRKENKISYSPEARKFISLSYSDDSLKRYGKIYGSYPITSKVHTFGGLDREITKLSSKGITKTYTSGLAYESCCWVFRLAHFQEDTGQGNNSNNYSTGFELILKGLGSTSTPLKGRIENNIKGYNSDFW